MEARQQPPTQEVEGDEEGQLQGSSESIDELDGGEIQAQEQGRGGTQERRDAVDRKDPQHQSKGQTEGQ